MKRHLLAAALFVLMLMPAAWAAPKSPYPDPYRQTMWNDVTDSIHTWGQTSQEARFTKIRLHAARAKTRLNSIQQDIRAKRRARMKAWQESQNSQL